MKNTILTENNIQLTGEYHTDCNILIDKIQEQQLHNKVFKQLVIALLPPMQAQLKNHKALLPDDDINKLCGDVEDLIATMGKMSY